MRFNHCKRLRGIFYENKSMLNLKEIKTIITHGSKFHGDDGAGSAMILLGTGKEFKLDILRLNEKELEEYKKSHDMDSVFVLDIGDGKYDHHFKYRPELQKFYPEDYSQVKGELVEKAACARIWEDFGVDIVLKVLSDRYAIYNADLAKTIAESVDREFISKLSDTDTKGQVDRPNEFSAIVTRRWEAVASQSKTRQDEVFLNIVSFFADEIRCRIIVAYEKLMKELSVVELAKDAEEAGHPTWINLTESYCGNYIQAHLFEKTNIRFTIIKSDRVEGQWNLLSVDPKKYPLVACHSYEGFVKHPIAPLVIFDSEENAEKAATFLSM